MPSKEIRFFSFLLKLYSILNIDIIKIDFGIGNLIFLN